MDLEPLLRINPDVALFDRQRDEADVFAMMDRLPMRLTGFELLYDRRPEFTALLRCRAENFVAPIVRQNERMRAIASFAWSPRWHRGTRENVCYVGDMRASTQRSVARVWRGCYPEILRLAHEQDIKYFLTVVMAENSEALRNLVETGKDYGFKYDFIRSLTMRNCLVKKPWAKLQPKTAAADAPFTLQYARPSDEPRIVEFLNRENRLKLFGYNFAEYEWRHRQKNWPGFDVRNFVLLLDAVGEIAACTLPWSPTLVKRMKLQSVGLAMSGFLRLCAIAGLRLPKENESVETLYLTHLTFSSTLSRTAIAQGLRIIIDEVMAARRGEFHMLSWADEWSVGDEVCRNYFTQNTKVNLYAVRLSSAPAMSESLNARVGFEMALV